MAKKNKKMESTLSTNTSSTTKRRKPKPNYKKAFMVGALFLAMLSFILTSIPNFGGGKSSKAASIPPPTSTNLPSTQSSTTFTKHGVLSISRKNNPAPLSVDIEVADTEIKRQQGLMHRKHMEPNRGMLFIMDRLKEQNFYMRNTFISLDIIYLDQDKKVVSIAKNTQTLSDTGIPSNGDALYVLEVVAGYAETHGVEVGDQIDWELL